MAPNSISHAATPEKRNDVINRPATGGLKPMPTARLESMFVNSTAMLMRSKKPAMTTSSGTPSTSQRRLAAGFETCVFQSFIGDIYGPRRSLAAFPEWQGVMLLCARSQGAYWSLVMRSELEPVHKDLSIVKGRRFGAAPRVEMGLRQLLKVANIDIERDQISIAPMPGAWGDATVNFGLGAAKPLDNYWTNGMGAKVAVTRAVGTVVLHIRRGDGPKGSLDYTMASSAANDRLIEQSREKTAAAVRTIAKTRAALKDDPR